MNTGKLRHLLESVEKTYNDGAWIAPGFDARAVKDLLRDMLAFADQPSPVDAERLGWIERNLFERKWGGTLGQPYDWFIRGDFRHTTQRMRGNDFRAAIDAAMRATPADGGEG